MKISREDSPVALVPLTDVSDNESVDDLIPHKTAHAEPGTPRDQQGTQESCPYCGRAMIERSEDHIFPQFMGGTRTIACCKPCNDRFGHRFEGKAAQWFQKLHFYFAAQGLSLKVPQIRWKEAFERDGRHYDAVFENGEAKFTLSRPIVSIDNGVMNAQLGSLESAPRRISRLRRQSCRRPRLAWGLNCRGWRSRCARRLAVYFRPSPRTSCILHPKKHDAWSQRDV
jgi:HNH endonuclease